MVKCFKIQNQLLRMILAELLGTFVLASFVFGSATQNNLSGYYNQLQQNIGAGVGMMLAIYIAADVSGAHVNPAITLTFCLDKRSSWRNLPFFWTIQFIAAFIAAIIQFGLSYDFVQHFNSGIKNSTSAAVFVAYPAPITGTIPSFFNQVFATFFLCLGSLCLTDNNNSLVSPVVAPVAVGLLVSGICCAFGLNGGPTINPVLDLAPRTLLTLVGWGTQPFSFRNYGWFWVPLLGPLLGGFLGWAFYKGLITQHKPMDNEEKHSEGQNIKVDEKNNDALVMTRL